MTQLIDLLRERTVDVHRALEAQLVGRIKSISSLQDYSRLLRLMYGYYDALERHIQPHVETNPDLDFFNRRKAAWLIHDMEMLGDASDLQRCQHLPSINNATAAIGAMYVLEGSTLGGQHIATMIQKKLVLSDDALTFFHSYKGDTPAMWERFKQVLTHPFDSRQQQDIIQAAHDTFVTFMNWINKHGADKL